MPPVPQSPPQIAAQSADGSPSGEALATAPVPYRRRRTSRQGNAPSPTTLPHASSGGCPYKQEETGPSRARGGPSSGGEELLPPPLLAAAAAALLVLLGGRVALGPKRRLLLSLFLAVMLVPRWRDAVRRALAIPGQHA